MGIRVLRLAGRLKRICWHLSELEVPTLPFLRDRATSRNVEVPLGTESSRVPDLHLREV